MPLESAVREVAACLLDRDFVLIHAHHDSDGIAAGSILCHALRRADVPFRMRTGMDAEPADMKGDLVLCDIGSQLHSLPEDTVVIDHHTPIFEGPYHVNPHLFGIDGQRDLSASAAAYLIAMEMGDNADLAGIALLGMLGDRQAIAGENRRIVNEGIAKGVIEPAKGLLLAGGDDVERLLYAIDPYLPGVSGNEAVCRGIAAALDGGEGEGRDLLLSRLVLEAAAGASTEALTRLYGTRYLLKRECLEDAHTLMALVDSCGKSERGGLGTALCLRHVPALEDAVGVMRHFRRQVIEALTGAGRGEGALLWIEVPHSGLTGSVADALAWDMEVQRPVAVFAREGGRCRISLRAPRGMRLDLGAIARSAADACGGSGGGHTDRAGALVETEMFGCFRERLAEAFG
ncbi:MAG: DHH family phosphoesterase [Methanomicrobiales archaeon]|nr:DHH family phosphoesterase [Methanomicrobiales archaeon]